MKINLKNLRMPGMLPVSRDACRRQTETPWIDKLLIPRASFDPSTHLCRPTEKINQVWMPNRLLLHMEGNFLKNCSMQRTPPEALTARNHAIPPSENTSVRLACSEYGVRQVQHVIVRGEREGGRRALQNRKCALFHR